MNSTMYYLFGGLLVLAFVAGMLTWRGCTKPQVTHEVRTDTTWAHDTSYVDREIPMIVRRNFPVPIRDTNGVFNLVQTGIDLALAEYNASHQDSISDLVAVGTSVKPDHKLDWEFHYREKFLDYKLEKYDTDTLQTQVCNSTFFDEVVKYGFWGYTIAAAGTIVYMILTNNFISPP